VLVAVQVQEQEQRLHVDLAVMMRRRKTWMVTMMARGVRIGKMQRLLQRSKHHQGKASSTATGH
jgi:hypothetical protein